ncbi:hypothetical protein IWW55_004394, partial [Coemansia sp. RSA 2706]
MVRQAEPSRGISSDGAHIAQWFNALPVCTRFLLEATCVLTLVAGFQLVPGYHMAMSWPAVTGKFQLWRLVTTFLTT